MDLKSFVIFAFKMGRILLNTQLYARMKRENQLNALATYIFLSKKYPSKIFRQARSYNLGLSKTKICADLHILVRYKLASVENGMVSLASKNKVKSLYGGDAKLYCAETAYGHILKFLKFLPALKVLKSQQHIINRRAHLCTIIEESFGDPTKKGIGNGKASDESLDSEIKELRDLEKNGTYRNDTVVLTFLKIAQVCGCSLHNARRYREYMSDLGYISVGKQLITNVFVSDDYASDYKSKSNVKSRKRNGVNVASTEFCGYAVEFHPSPITVWF